MLAKGEVKFLHAGSHDAEALDPGRSDWLRDLPLLLDRQALLVHPVPGFADQGDCCAAAAAPAVAVYARGFGDDDGVCVRLICSCAHKILVDPVFWRKQEGAREGALSMRCIYFCFERLRSSQLVYEKISLIDYAIE